VAPDKHSHVGFVNVAPSHGQHHLGEVILGGVEVKSIQVEKNECSYSTDALVAIDEGMVLDQVEQTPGFDSHSYTKTGKRQNISQIQTE